MPDERPLLPPPAVLDALEAAEAGLGTTIAYRVLVLRRGQTIATPQDFVRENTAGARWNPPGTAALYTSLERETAGAEGAHLSAVNDLPTSRLQIGVLELHLERVVDLSDPDALPSVGLSRDDVEADDHSACRLIGSACAWLGMPGVLVPSGRRWPASNLVVFPNNFSTADYVEPSGEPADWTL